MRALWEARYRQPSLNNPLFEECNLYEHLRHLLALQALEEAPEAPDENLERIAELTEKGLDPFADIRGKLASLSARLTQDDDGDGDDELDDLVF